MTTRSVYCHLWALPSWAPWGDRGSGLMQNTRTHLPPLAHLLCTYQRVALNVRADLPEPQHNHL